MYVSSLLLLLKYTICDHNLFVLQMHLEVKIFQFICDNHEIQYCSPWPIHEICQLCSWFSQGLFLRWTDPFELRAQQFFHLWQISLFYSDLLGASSLSFLCFKPFIYNLNLMLVLLTAPSPLWKSSLLLKQVLSLFCKKEEPVGNGYASGQSGELKRKLLIILRPVTTQKHSENVFRKKMCTPL